MLGYSQSAASATVAEVAQVEARTAAYFLFVMAITDRQLTAGCSQPVLKRFQVRPMHKWHSQTLAIQLMISASSLVYSCVACIVTACSGSPHNVLHFLVYTVKLLSPQMCAHLGLHQLTFAHPLVYIPLHAVKGLSQASIMAHSSCCIQCSSY